jgi:adenosine deaminase
MCKSPLHSLLAALPKCEHHLHLEGTLSPALYFELARKNNVKPPEDDPAFFSPEALLDRYAHFTSLDDFLHYYWLGFEVLQTPDDFETLAMEYFTKAKSDGVHHAEVFFDPEAHQSRGVEYQTAVRGFRIACQRAEKELGITTKLIICVLRDFPVQSARDTLDVAVAAGHFTDGTLAGLGIASTELGNPPKKWEGVFTAAKNAGIRRTAHAGEEGPPQFVEDCLNFLHAKRIDHGRTLAEDPVLVERVADQKILITLCPISNVRTHLKGIKGIGDMPIRMFLDAGVCFSINSDDPAYFGGYILDNYCAVQEEFDLNLAEWQLIASNSIEGSWCSNERKEQLHQAVKITFDKFTR